MIINSRNQDLVYMWIVKVTFQLRACPPLNAFFFSLNQYQIDFDLGRTNIIFVLYINDYWYANLRS